MNISIESLYQKIFDSALVAIGITDLEGRFVLVNHTWCTMLGYKESEALNLTLDDIIPVEDKDTSDKNYQKLINCELSSFHKTRIYKRKDGTTFWADLNVSPIFNDQGKVEGVLGVFIDIDRQVRTEMQLKDTNHVLEVLNKELSEANKEITQKNRELSIAYKKLEELARTDSLTGLYNRKVLDEMIKAEIRRTHRNNRGFTIAICDIDDFKQFNDKYGHDCGDLVLKGVAEVLKNSIRATDYLGRWGGEEFLIVLPETDCNGSEVVVERIRINVANHIVHYRENSLMVTITIGYSYFSPTSEYDSVLKEADTALYAGKQRGKNIALCYSDNLFDCQMEISNLWTN